MQLWRAAPNARTVHQSKKEVGKKNPPLFGITVSFLWLLLAKPNGKPEGESK